ncbi:MAG: hypothetical protein JO255_07455, partial [Alphaproteobacteria bacterium]|nr:hypothetical protein [Alphaproteobacteria bacterium]
FTNFLPNAVYLYDHGFFPADDRAHAFAIWPAFPYNAQLATYLATLFLPEFPPGALTLFNILLQIMAGLFLARVLQSPSDPLGAAPSWGACAGGLLLATVLNPGFVPRIDFTSYAEPALTVVVALLGWLGVRILGDRTLARPSGPSFVLFALLLIALVNIKQVGIVLGFGVVASLVVLALADRHLARLSTVLAFVASCVPALALYGVWRAYVLTHFQSGELKLLPPAMWDFSFLPTTFTSMLQEIAEKPVYFGILAIVVALALWLVRRDGLTERSRLLLLIIGLFLIYNAFLVLIYVIHMGPVAGEAAHSYFRYMTHLSLLIVSALTLVARDWWEERRSEGSLLIWRRILPPVAVAVALIMPIVFVKRLRFDLQMPQPLIWDLAHNVASQLNDGDKLALLLPGDNGSDSIMLRAALELTPPRVRDLDVYDVTQVEGGLAAAVERGYTWALVSCLPSADPPEAALMSYDGSTWHVNADWPYPAVKPKERWTTVLTAGPVCH